MIYVYIALSVLFLAVLFLALYVRWIFRALRIQAKLNGNTTCLLGNLHNRATVNEARLAELRRTQQAESILHALEVPDVDPMRN